MPMKLSVGGGGDSEYEVPPIGEHKAICYRVIDGGSAEEEYQGETSSTEYEPVRKCVHSRIMNTPHRSRARAATPHKKHKQR